MLLSSKTQPLQISLQVESRLMIFIMNGEVQIPPCVVVGPDHRSRESASKIKRAESLAADTVFSMTNERKKLSKHLKLGIAVKSMTGSKKLIGMLNRYGHCVSYPTTEELQTKLMSIVTSASKISPPDLVPDSSLTFGIAFDKKQIQEWYTT